MIDLKLFRIRNFGFGSLGAALNYLCFFLTLFIIPFFFDQILHASALETGIYMTITPLVMTVSAPIAGALSDRIGSRRFSMTGMLFSTVSLVLFGIMAHISSSPYFLLILGLVCAGLGTGLFAAPNNSAIMGAAPLSQQGLASGVLATFRYIGMIAGTTVGGSLFTALISGYTQPGRAESAIFLHAFSAVMWIGAAFGILGFVCTFFMSKAPGLKKADVKTT
jgi:MFS family permease